MLSRPLSRGWLRPCRPHTAWQLCAHFRQGQAAASVSPAFSAVCVEGEAPLEACEHHFGEPGLEPHVLQTLHERL